MVSNNWYFFVYYYDRKFDRGFIEFMNWEKIVNFYFKNCNVFRYKTKEKTSEILLDSIDKKIGIFQIAPNYEVWFYCVEMGVPSKEVIDCVENMIDGKFTKLSFYLRKYKLEKICAE